VAASSRAGFAAAAEAFARAGDRGLEIATVRDRFADRAQRAARYGKAWAPYVWRVSSVGDLKIARSIFWQRGRVGSIRIMSGTWAWPTVWLLQRTAW